MNFMNKQVGSYRLIEMIGRGAYGSVFRAQHMVIPARVAAIKFLNAGVDLESKRAKFLQEASFLETLKHRYILEVFDANIDEDGTPFIISRFASGGSLDRRLQQAGGRLPAGMVMKILNQVGEALEHAHQQNVIHRDLKPGNILFNENDDAVLSDFGIATSVSTDSLRHTQALGTPYYMAPEQIKDLICKESDQYALGCLAYELCAGRRVFEGQNTLEIFVKHTEHQPTPPSVYNPQLPAYIDRAILRALAKRREERYPSVSAFVRALNNQPDFVDDVPPTLASLVFSQSSVQPARPAPEVAPSVPPQPASARQPQKRAAEQVNLGNILAIQDEPDLAALALVARSDPKNAGAQVKYGRALYALKRYQEARKAFQKAVDLEPRNSGYLHWLGLAQHSLKQYPGALASFQKASQVEPMQAVHFQMLGEVHSELQQYELALVPFGEAARLDPGNATYRQRLEEARAQFNKKLAQTPVPLPASQAQAQPQGQKAQTEPQEPKASAAQPQAPKPAAQPKQQPAQAKSQAAAPVKKAQPGQAQAKPQEQKSQPAPAQAKPQAATPAKQQPAPAQAKPQEQKQPSPAQSQGQKAQAQPKPQATTPAKQQPGPAQSQAPKAQVQAQAKPQPQAQAKPKTNKGDSLPDNANGCHKRGMELYNKQDYAGALTAFDRAVQLEPRNPNYLCWQGRAFAALDLHAEALAAFEGAINARPTLHEGHFRKAEALRALGRPKEAEKALAIARQLSGVPKHLEPSNNASPSNGNQSSAPQASDSQPGEQENLLQRFFKRLLP